MIQIPLILNIYNMAILDNLGKYRNTGLLLLRIGIGILFIIHGFPKLAGGPSGWTGLGGSMKVIGIDFLPIFWALWPPLRKPLVVFF
ncbi:DoxX family membrane protein [Pedobacter fastidiosus]|uniref:DoxX family membrane protein n=1 Tax=Pedobacter fastidiosus TaxID=2765361 RepID=UPI003622D891